MPRSGRDLAILDRSCHSIDWANLFSRVRRTQPADGDAARAGRFPAVSHTVWALGWTSLFTDVSSEMVASVLPLYLVLHLGMSPLAFGVVDGLYQGAAALVRVAAGILSDRWQRHKAIAVTGYALSAACRFCILLAGASWSSITAIIVADRIGKGIRTAPRDALISQRTESSQLATAFGVHRALDAAGAMVGPVVAFLLLARAPDEFDLLFVTSFAIAVVGVFVIVLFVPAHREEDPDLNAAPPSLAGAMSLLTERRFRAILIAGSLLGVATISDAFVYLVLQQGLALTAMAFPLLYVGTSLCNSLFSVPCGRLADRHGRGLVLLAGYIVLGIVYLVTLVHAASPVAVTLIAIALLGAYYAATDGVLTAMAAAVLPASRSGSGLALLATATNLTRLISSIAFGWLWMIMGPTGATLAYFVALLAAIVVAAAVLLSPDSHATSGTPDSAQSA